MFSFSSINKIAKSGPKALFLLGLVLLSLNVTSCPTPTALSDSKYKVTYVSNGATSGTVPIDINSYNPGASVTVLGNTGGLALAGSTFVGWNTQANGSGTSYTAGATLTMGSANIVLYAIWTTLPTYTISYNSNGATSGTAPTDSNNYLSGDIATVQTNSGSLARSGFTFAGWNTLANGTGTPYTGGSTLTMGSANVILYAVWTTQPTYTVTYNSNGATSGTAPTDSNSYLSGANATVLTNSGSLARTGYAFAGWNTQANGSGTSYQPGSTLSIASANVTLYASWTNSNTGTITISNPITYTVSIAGPSTVYVGVAATFTSTYTGSPQSYQWYLDGTPLSGATTASLSLTPTATTGNFGLNQLMLVITDANGLTYSGSLSMTLSN